MNFGVGEPFFSTFDLQFLHLFLYVVIIRTVSHIFIKVVIVLCAPFLSAFFRSSLFAFSHFGTFLSIIFLKKIIHLFLVFVAFSLSHWEVFQVDSRELGYPVVLGLLCDQNFGAGDAGTISTEVLVFHSLDPFFLHRPPHLFYQLLAKGFYWLRCQKLRLDWHGNLNRLGNAQLMLLTIVRLMAMHFLIRITLWILTNSFLHPICVILQICEIEFI